MVQATQIHPDKLRAYLSTAYRLGHTEQDIVLCIGVRSERLAAQFAATGKHCGAFLTAYNPRGCMQSELANASAHSRLADVLQGLKYTFIEGAGIGTDGEWPAERSYFVPGMDLALAKSIGIQFDQDAIVWIGADAIPQLILLR